MKFYNSLSKKKELFKPLKDNLVNFYVCGPTVYGPSHLGHAVTYIRFDFIRRFLEFLGYKVKFIMNITDIHDDILKRARQLKKSPQELSNEYTNEFLEDLKKLRIKKAYRYPRVSQNLSQIITLIKKLVDKKCAYETDDGVYFSVDKFKNYGKLAGIKLEKGISGLRVRTDKYEKEALVDFALWKKENDEWLFDSPWGKGRPGWHIECSAISIKYLGIPFDIHGGGMDLKFPHHENEIAQSESSYQKKFVNFFLHSGLLYVNNQKMSKSLNNYIELKDFFKKYPFRFLRFFVFFHHYRSIIDFSEKNINNAWETYFNFNEKLRRFKNKKTNVQTLKRIYKALNDDFNTPLAFSLIYKAINESKISITDIKNLDKFLLIFFPWRKLTLEEKNLIKKRKILRINKKFNDSDKIRKRLETNFIYLQDSYKNTQIINLN